MSESGLKTAQIAALLAVIPAAFAFLIVYSELPAHEEVTFFISLLFLAVTGICAAVAYAVSLIWLFVFWFNTARVGNKTRTLAAVALPALFFAAAAVLLKQTGFL